MFEKADRIGGLLRYGIPDFKLEKRVLDRRLEQMMAEGVQFHTSAHVGESIPPQDLRKEFDALVLTGGAENPRDLNVPGRELKGIYFAMQFLPQQNKVVAGDEIPNQILATGKRVVIIGGGDTGADCLGTCHRHQAKSIHQFEIMPMPPAGARSEHAVAAVALAASHRERPRRRRQARLGSQHRQIYRRRKRQRQRTSRPARRPPPKFEALPGTEFMMETDLVLLALGFTGPVKRGMIEQLGVNLDPRGNIATGADYMSSVPGVFAAGDMRRGQSLVVWAISEGRKAAASVDKYLMGSSTLA